MRPRLCLALAALALAAGPARAAAQAIAYPTAPRDTVVDVYFGTRVPAPYRWMEELGSPATRTWIAAENQLTDARLSAMPEPTRFRERLTRLWNYPRTGVPSREAGRLYYRENSGLQRQSVLYSRASVDAPPRVVLDPNALSADGSLALQGYSVSPDGRYLAYGLAEGGSDLQHWVVRDLSNDRATGDTVRNLKFTSANWTHDSRGFFYTRYATPEKGKELSGASTGARVYYHALGTSQAEDRLIYERPDQPRAFLGASVSEDGRYLWLYVSAGGTENELWYKDLRDPARPALGAPVLPVSARADAEFSPLGNVGDTLFLQTSLDAPNRRIVAVALPDSARAHWRTVVPEGKEVIENSTLAGGRVAVQTLQDVKSRLSLFDLGGRPAGEIPLPGIGTVSGLGGRVDTPELWYAFASYLTPGTVYRYDLASGRTQTFAAPKLTFDPSAYAIRQVFYPSKDGTKVPMFIVARKDVQLDGTHPTLLYAYGGFDISMLPSFSPVVAGWLEEGGVYAVANLRGGGEYGEAWHSAGMREKKQNVFDDFIAAAQYLIDQRYTSTPHLAVMGGSNGGLLVGAVMTQRPELFGVALPEVGVMDMLRYQKFTGGAFWVPEYGSSDVEGDFRYLIEYSPLQNVREGTCYPPTLLTTADHDDRVVPSHTYQFTAALQQAQACANPILLRVETEGSHGYRPTDKQIAEAADQLGFAWHYLTR